MHGLIDFLFVRSLCLSIRPSNNIKILVYTLLVLCRRLLQHQGDVGKFKVHNKISHYSSYNMEGIKSVGRQFLKHCNRPDFRAGGYAYHSSETIRRRRGTLYNISLAVAGGSCVKLNCETL